MVTEEVMEALEKLYEALDVFVKLVGLEYTDDDEYVCNNRDQVDEEWCDDEMLESIENAHADLGYFLSGRKERKEIG